MCLNRKTEICQMNYMAENGPKEISLETPERVETKKPTIKKIGDVEFELDGGNQIIRVFASSSEIETPSQVISAILPPGTKPLPEAQTSAIKPPSGVSEIRYNSSPAGSHTLYKPVSFKSDISIEEFDKLPPKLIKSYSRCLVKSVEVDAKLHELIKNFSESDYFVRIKNPTRALEKFLKRESRKQVKDLLGMMLAVGDQKDVDDALKAIWENFGIISKEDYFKIPNRWGYRGINLRAQEEGLIFEIQIHTQKTRAATLRAHPIYEKLRKQKFQSLTSKQKVEFLKDVWAVRKTFKEAVGLE